MSKLVIREHDCKRCEKDNGFEYKKYQYKFESNVEKQFEDKDVAVFKISCKFYKEA